MRIHALPSLALLAMGCAEPLRKHRSAGPDCGEGWIADGDACVPEACGTGTWGDLAVDSATVYVDATAEGGDGSAEAPYRSIQPALDLAGDMGSGLVAVAAGTYPETLTLTPAHAGVHLAGRCRELVVLDASVGGESAAGIEITAGFGEVEVSGLAVVGSGYKGLRVRSGVVRLAGLGVEGSASYGIDVHRSSALAPSTVVIDGCELDDNGGVGVTAYDAGTEVTLMGTAIRDTRSDREGGGYGIEVSRGATLRADGCELDGNTKAGILADGSGTGVTLVDTAVRDTRLNPDEQGAAGVAVQTGAALRADGCELADNLVLGIAAANPGTEVTLVDTVVRDTRPKADGMGGYGVEVSDGAAFTAEGGAVAGNWAIGILALDSGTQVVLSDSTISGTARGFGERSAVAIGLCAQAGAMVSASGLQVRDNEGPGLVAIGGGVQLSCDGCSLRGNQLAGAVVYLGGALVLEGTEVTGTAQSSNLDGGVGVLAANSLGSTPPSVVVRDSTISDNRVAGVWLTGSGSYQISGNRVSGTADVPPRSSTRCGDGVYAAGTGAWDGTSGLLLDGNTLADNQGAGLFLDNGWADLEGNTWSGNSPDLWVQGEACLTPREDYAEAPESEICPKHDRTPCDLLFSLIPDISDIDSARPPPLWSALSRKPPSP